MAGSGRTQSIDSRNPERGSGDGLEVRPRFMLLRTVEVQRIEGPLV